MFKELSKGRLFGHPVHPMLVHFPTALFFVSFLCDVAWFWGFDKDLSIVSFYCLSAGLAGGLLAGLFGLVDYSRLAARSSKDVFEKATWHGGIQFAVLVIFGTVLGMRYEGLSEMTQPGWLELTVSGTGIVLMLAGNYLGGDLVFRHGAGSISTERDWERGEHGSDE